MADHPVLTRARETLRAATHEIDETTVRLEAGPAPISFELAKARRILHEAESAVRDLVLLLNATPGAGINFTLIRSIVSAERRVKQARLAVRTIRPPSAK